MSVFELPKQFHPDFATPNKKPVGPVEIDWSNPLTLGLVRYWTGNSKTDLVAGVKLNNGVGNGSGAVIAPKYGKGPSFIFDSDDSLYESVATPISGSQNRTFLSEIYHNTSNTGYIFNISDGDSSQSPYTRWGIRQDASTGLRVEITGAGYTSSLNANNGWHFVGCRLDGTTLADHTLFVDADSENASGTSTVSTDASHTIGLGNRDWLFSTPSVTNVEIIHWGALWDRALTDAEVRSIRENPYQILKPAIPQYYFTSAATGATYTLTASPGSISLSGTDASLLFGRSLTASAGSISLSGTDASLLYGRSLAASPGSISLTGVDATLTYNAAGSYTLTADPGAISLSGTDASLLFGRSITASPGAVSISGTDVSLVHGYNMTADGGSIALSGVDAAFRWDHVLTATPGVMVLSGTDVTLTYSGASAWTLQTNSSDTWTLQTNSSDTWTLQTNSSDTWTVQ